ncbi:bifunctional 2-polyprenyl-6-hydroxyphenol methylase/3-demethylubiquinol 3-O-methyltransferase UbiG [Streptomyces sp. NBC_00083]|uniref:class I SAM-dependent methyltransferase n=1 Tax=Streptomyces sp. NBC_00083 TaxID=2975647 RepID=UPI00224E35EE|nr:class I SAM-dependent methyltransferase [Streptomyces sp. NBC_00083]MCX5386992.1 class I SAM-dependent methyltransferase [Streptomyces sp. NBC_00083]
MFDYVARTLAAYEQSVPKYEAATRDMVPDVELDAFTALLPDPSGPVLDAGCAFGRDTALLAARGVAVTGIDLSEPFLARARELHPGLAFRRMDVCRLDFDDASFAGVWCQATLLHLKDEHVKGALAEFRRVLRLGGALFVSFKEGEGEEEIVEPFSADAARFFRYQSVQRVHRLLETAGFDRPDVRVVNERARYGAGHRDLTWLTAYGRAT